MKSFLWRIPLALIGLGGIGTCIFGIYFKITHPIPWGEGGIMLVGLCVALLPLCGGLIWTSTWDEF